MALPYHVVACYRPDPPLDIAGVILEWISGRLRRLSGGTHEKKFSRLSLLPPIRSAGNAKKVTLIPDGSRRVILKG